MKQYLDLLRHILNHGVLKPTRAVLPSTGQRIDAVSVFGYQTRFDLQVGFPAVTTKKLAFNAVAHELLWFLSGSTNVKYLQERGVHIWDEWADEQGEVGPIYSAQWRRWQTPDGQHLDQILNLVNGIEDVKINPAASIGRRLILSAWNVGDLPRMRLPPCHVLSQFSVTRGQLSCQLYQRSADAFLGVPFNIASYALLTHLLAHVTGLEVGELVHTFGDLHIYTNHMEQVREQLGRTPHPLPHLLIDNQLRRLEDVCREHFYLQSYRHHPALPGEVAV